MFKTSKTQGIFFVLFAMLMSDCLAAEIYRVSATPIKGEVLNLQTREVINYAVVNASWVIEPVSADSSETERRLAIQQVKVDDKGSFTIPGWSTNRKIPLGWRVKPGFDPVITIFSNGYYHGEFRNIRSGKDNKKSVNAPGVKKLLSIRKDSQFLLQPFSDYQGKGMYAGPQWSAELSTWKYFIDAEREAFAWKGKFRSHASQTKLAGLLAENCQIIQDIEQDSVCSEISISTEKKTEATPYEPTTNTSALHQQGDHKPVKEITQSPGMSFDDVSPN